ncbi:MAG: type II toxin-antitoxin system VapC family toxin [Gammaproteobacteria bacterium]|nr:type II toxin-antitoxin system VapC family toxin [Gammaproteobacteria bacterium]
MTGLDTNVLARYYIQDDSDAEAEQQHLAARNLLESGQAFMVCKTVFLELEWVMRGYYGFAPEEIAKVFHHLLAFRHMTVEDRAAVEHALANFEQRLDFADALHHASYRECAGMASFDDKKFARRSSRLGLMPRVSVPRV